MKNTSKPQSNFPTGAHIPELDGIRAIAIWMVLCDHILDGWHVPTATMALVPNAVRFFFGHGWLGVDLFFVLSGFLITGILLDSRNSPSYFRNFYTRRFLRIVPLYYTVIAVSALCYADYTKYFLLSLLFLANFADAFAVKVPHGPGVFWSLAVEEHFYLAWPWLVRFLNRKALICVALGIVLASPLFRLWASMHSWPIGAIYAYSFFRLDGLALGSLLAIWVRSNYATRTRSTQLAAVLVGASAILTVLGSSLGLMGTGSVLRYTQTELVFAGFVLAVVSLRGTILVAPLRWWFAKLSGDLSYCIYLVHLSLGDGYYQLLRVVGIHQIAFGPIGLLAVRAVAILTGSFGIALLSRRFLERPVLGLKKHFEYTSLSLQRSGAHNDLRNDAVVGTDPVTESL